MVTVYFLVAPTGAHRPTEADNHALADYIWSSPMKKYTDIYLVGDFNFPSINSFNSTAVNAEQLFLNAVNNAYLCQHVDQPTRRRGNDNPSLTD